MIKINPTDCQLKMNSEVWLRAQYQTVIKERDQLQSELVYMERENQDLRRSVFELSYQLSQLTPSNFFRIQRQVGFYIVVLYKIEQCG